jgi:hypothetical protein
MPGVEALGFLLMQDKPKSTIECQVRVVKMDV